jgi:Uma2 family endonuclease
LTARSSSTIESLIHAELQARILIALRTWTEGTQDRGIALLGPAVAVDEHNLYAPDVVWIAEEHRPRDLDCSPDRLADLCVEIRSPGTWRYDVGAKKAGYERAGLRELWLVDDSAKCVLVFRRSDREAPTFDVALELAAGDELGSPQLPGFALSVEELFDI